MNQSLKYQLLKLFKKYRMKNKSQNKKFLLIYILIIVILIISNVFFIFKINQNNYKKVVNQYPYIDFSRNFSLQKDYITNIQPLREKLNELALNYPKENISIYVEYLNTGANIAINQDTYIFPASLLKLPIALTVMKKVELGEWTLDNELVLFEEDKDGKSGDESHLLSKDVTGSRYTIRDLLISSLRDSDNTAFNILYRNISDNELEKFIDSIGLDKITNGDGKISSKEYSRILRSLYTASFLKRDNAQLILKWLDDSSFDSFLSSGLPKEISFSHKYGENLEQRVFADSGIVYIPNRPYIISVMIKGDDKNDLVNEKTKAENLMKEISEFTYNYFSSYNN